MSWRYRVAVLNSKWIVHMSGEKPPRLARLLSDHSRLAMRHGREPMNGASQLHAALD